MNGEIQETHKLRDAAALLSAVLSSTSSSATDYFSQQNELLSWSFSCLDIAKAFDNCFNCFKWSNNPTESKPQKQSSGNIHVDVLSEITRIKPADLNKPELMPELLEAVFGKSKERIAQAKAHIATGELVLSNLLSYIDNEKLPSKYSNDPLFGKVFNELWRPSDFGPPKDVFDNKSSSEKIEISDFAIEVLQSSSSRPMTENHGREIDWIYFILASAHPQDRLYVRTVLSRQLAIHDNSLAGFCVSDALCEHEQHRDLINEE